MVRLEYRTNAANCRGRCNWWGEWKSALRPLYHECGTHIPMLYTGIRAGKRFNGIVNLSRCHPHFLDENEYEPLSWLPVSAGHDQSRRLVVSQILPCVTENQKPGSVFDSRAPLNMFRQAADTSLSVGIGGTLCL